MKESTFSVGVVGWFEGTAGLLDSWLPEIGFEVKCFIAVDSRHTSVDRSSHSRFENKKFSYPSDGHFKNKPLFEDSKWYLNPSKYMVDTFIVALDDAKERMSHINLALANKVPLISAIHPSATLLSDYSLGENCIVHAGVIVGYKAIVGNGVILNTGVQLDHHVVVEDGVTIDPGCIIAGNVLIRQFATLHTNTTVINKIIIGHAAITGAGSVVIKDVEQNSTVVGVPARRIK